MAQTIRIESIGTRKILKKLDALPAKIRTKIVRKVLSKATTVMKQEIVKRAPVGSGPATDENGKPRKRLKKVFTKSLRTAKGKTGMHGLVGIPPDYGRHVYMLHYGIKPHTIRAKNGRSMAFAGGRYASVNHPGVSAMPFMREALAASIPKSRAIMATALRTQLASVAR